MYIWPFKHLSTVLPIVVLLVDTDADVAVLLNETRTRIVNLINYWDSVKLQVAFCIFR